MSDLPFAVRRCGIRERIENFCLVRRIFWLGINIQKENKINEIKIREKQIKTERGRWEINLLCVGAFSTFTCEMSVVMSGHTICGTFKIVVYTKSLTNWTNRKENNMCTWIVGRDRRLLMCVWKSFPLCASFCQCHERSNEKRWRFPRNRRRKISIFRFTILFHSIGKK